MYHTPMPTTIGQNIRRAREVLDWSQEDLATHALGGAKNQAQLSRYENGVNVPSLRTLSRIAHALNLSAADLLHDAHCEGEAV